MFETGDLFVGNGSGIASSEGRLNFRYSKLIEPIKNSFEYKTILDLGTYDGRWTYVCWKLNAKKVFCYDLRQNSDFELRLNSIGIPSSFFDLNKEDLNTAILPKVDIVLCMGILYYMKNPKVFLEKLSKLDAETIIIDTVVGIQPKKNIYEIPEKNTFELWMNDFFEFSEIPMKESDQPYLSDYYNGKRCSYHCKPKNL